MSEIKVKDREHFETALKRFRKTVEKSGILQDLRKYEYYEKPSVKQKRKRAAAKKRTARQDSKR